MALSICVRCGGNTFEVIEQRSVKNSNFKLNFVQCSGCGGVVGVLDFYNIGNMLHELAQKLGVRLSE
jgi:hypothetical protein